MPRRLVVCLAFALAACGGTKAVVSTSASPSTTGDELDDAGRARQALNRLTFGARAADLAEVERIGVRAWVDGQLHPDGIADPVADSVLARLEITNKTAFELYADHPQPNEYGYQAGKQPDTAEIRRKAAGDSMTQALDAVTLQAKLAEATVLMKELPKLLPTRQAAIRELGPSILIRAVSSDRQLLEVMTDFWENHFSVSVGQGSESVHARRVRPRRFDRTRLGKFRDLLGAVAKSPQMLFYLDNYQSVVDSLHPNPVEWRIEERRREHPPLGDTLLAHTVAAPARRRQRELRARADGAAHARRGRRLYATRRPGSRALPHRMGRSTIRIIGGGVRVSRGPARRRREDRARRTRFPADAASRTASRCSTFSRGIRPRRTSSPRSSSRTS